MPQGLEGTKVLDLSRKRTMPHRSIMLGDAGPAMVMAERPALADEIGRLGPARAWERSVCSKRTHRNSNCITVDLRNKEGQEILRPLPRRSAILPQDLLPASLVSIRILPPSSRQGTVVTRHLEIKFWKFKFYSPPPFPVQQTVSELEQNRHSGESRDFNGVHNLNDAKIPPFGKGGKGGIFLESLG
jgi:CoA-transferase family III